MYERRTFDMVPRSNEFRFRDRMQRVKLLLFLMDGKSAKTLAHMKR